MHILMELIKYLESTKHWMKVDWKAVLQHKNLNTRNIFHLIHALTVVFDHD